MYAQQSLQDTLFMMMYSVVAMLAIVAGLYLWLRRANAIAPAITPPKALRRWTAMFLFVAALSHVWWYVLGIHWLTDDRLVRNITAVTLDHITLVPLVMAMLLRMLQDLQRRFWPWVLAQLPIVVSAVVGIVQHDKFYGFDLPTYWQLTVMTLFLIYYVRALIQYGRWLRENYVDMEHKEVWQSLLFVVALFIIYEVYFTNPGEMVREYMAQVNTLVIILFLLWRVETLQQLEPATEESEEVPKGLNIVALLEKHCEDQQLYLQHDLTLQQLATTIGTNRTYLSSYFAQQGITYNAYINQLRIEHFERLHAKAVALSRSVTAQELALESGFRSYSTFAAAFKKHKGISPAAWMRGGQTS